MDEQNRLFPAAVEARQVSPLALAFVGDGVYDLCVREMLVAEANRPVGDLHREAVKLVRAEAQAAAAVRLMPLLSEEEAAVFRRGRNAHTNRTGSAYHHATGLEALFGYLYLDGRIDRVRELFRLATAPQEDGCKEVSL